METLVLNTSLSQSLYISAFLGAFGQEILHWFNLRTELKNQVTFYKSPTYWVITIVSILFFGLTAPLIKDLVDIKANISEDTKLFITALLYPIIIKQVLKLITKNLQSSGLETEIKPSTTSKVFKIKDYFN